MIIDLHQFAIQTQLLLINVHNASVRRSMKTSDLLVTTLNKLFDMLYWAIPFANGLQNQIVFQ